MRRILPGIIIFLIIFSPTKIARADSGSGDPLLIYFQGPQDSVFQALQIGSYFQLVPRPDEADILIINRVLDPPADLNEITQAGKGIILVPDENMDLAVLQRWLPDAIEFQWSDLPVSMKWNSNEIGMDVFPIVWTSAPQVYSRVNISAASLESLVMAYGQEGAVLTRFMSGNSRGYLLNSPPGGKNSAYEQWPYFNYLIYTLSLRSIGREPLPFSQYVGSPVPHHNERMVMFVLLSGSLVIAVAAFVLVRKYSKSHPELLENLVAQPEVYLHQNSHTDWQKIGFHRPLGGFLIAFMLGLVLFIPLILYQNLIMPVYILPSAQALGVWGRVVQFFNFFWLLLDMGTSVAFIKFFSQYRTKSPAQAIQFAQVYVWWQILSGAVQVAVITFIASVVLPDTPFGIYAWSIIIHTLVQIPGFYQVLRHAFMGWQRYDYAQVLDTGLTLLVPIFIQPVVVILMAAWGRANPIYGMPTGGLLGLGISAYLIEAVTFVVGLFLYRRLGYNTRILFLAHFDWKTIKEAFRFGVFEMFGSIAWAGGQAAEIIITQVRLLNYTEVWGNWVLAQNFVYSYTVLLALFSNLMPSISEAISNQKQVLSQYYSALAYKWGGMISAYIAALLLAVADRFILGASGDQFMRAASLAPPLIIWGAIQYPSWLGDNIQLAVNKPVLKAGLVAGEQILRLVLVLLLLERFQIYALIIAYFIGLFIKDIIAYFINNHLCYRQRFYFWQSIGAPILAGSVHFILVRWLTGFIWRGDTFSSVLIFLLAILPSYPIFAFLYGLAGGWDDPTLTELQEATQLTGIMRPFAWLFWKATSLGAKISPLHGRFPIDIRPAALAEADSLMVESISLVDGYKPQMVALS